MHPRVIQPRAGAGGFVYVGRPSKWGNPFTVAEHGREAMRLFLDRLVIDPEGRALAEAAPRELAGATLACPCAGRYPVCHAEVWAYLADRRPLVEIRRELLARIGLVDTGILVPDGSPELLALTIYQPHASLVATGAKRLETRSWAPYSSAIGRDFAIHAGMLWTEEQREGCFDGWPAIRAALVEGGLGTLEAVGALRGHILAVATLAEVVRFDNRCPCGFMEHRDDPCERHGPDERFFGDMTPGRFGWRWSNVRRLSRPVRARGSQGIWKVAPPLAAEVMASVPAVLA
jgi:hypothetical protein